MFNWFKDIDNEIQSLKDELELSKFKISTLTRHIDEEYIFLLNNIDIDKIFLNKNKYKQIKEFPGIMQNKIFIFMKENKIELLNDGLFCGEILEKLEQKEN
ncbi:MAG: hypothetical protein J6T10_26515 [Methanobrevibacter sp.]|nr:hypothetical protein [Methanobrevibacter sp.]